eukprot:2369809-Pyramimonas_sp.AAC.1
MLSSRGSACFASANFRRPSAVFRQRIDANSFDPRRRSPFWNASPLEGCESERTGWPPFWTPEMGTGNTGPVPNN